MEVEQLRLLWRWIIVLLSITTLTKCHSVFLHRGHQHQAAENPRNNRFYLHRVEPDIKQQTPVTTQPPEPRPVVVVNCHKDSLEVVVQADLFHTGIHVDGSHLHLGVGSGSTGSACGATPVGEAEFTIKAHLMDCGTKLSATKEKLIYSNILVYAPEPNIDGVLRLDGATIPIECRYDKTYAVAGAALHPTWAPFASKVTAEDHIDFNLRLMTDDWQFERGSHVYFLGDPIHLEVSVVMNNHQPLRVYVDHCVATATPDVDSTLRYDFIEHHGCLTDSSLTSSSSRFLPRVQDHRLRFQLDAFKFHRQSSNLIYISCHVKAVPAMLTVSSQNRACSFIDNRWHSMDGNDEACKCCDISQCSEKPMPTERPTTVMHTTVVQPTMTTQASLVWYKRKHHPASYFRISPGMHHNQENVALSSSRSTGIMKRGAGSRTEWTKNTRLGPLIILLSNISTTILPLQ